MPRKHEERRGARAWGARWGRALLAELLATALLVWLGLAAAVPLGPAAAVPKGPAAAVPLGPAAAVPKGPAAAVPLGPAPLTKPPLAHIAFSFGCVVVGCCVAFGPASGAHMNPAVTLAALVAGRLGAAPAAGYVLAQCAGAVLGFGALMLTVPLPKPLGVTCPAPDVAPAAAVLVEGGLTFLLALACCAAWAGPPDPAVPVKLGLLVAGLVFAGGPATGASLNPARSLAPALLHWHWEHIWIYWVGPLLGGALAAVLHRWVLTAPSPALPAPEDLPLADKP